MSEVGVEDGDVGRQSQNRAFWIYILVVTAIAGVLRILYLNHFAEPVPLICDAMGYYHMGTYLADGWGYVWWTDLMFHNQANPTAAYPPLYPGLLALFRFVGLQSVEVQREAIALLGTINVPILGLAGRRLVGTVTGVAASALATISPAMIATDGSYMTEGLYTILISLVLFVMLKANRPPNWSTWGFVGILLGLASLTRSEGVILLGILVLPTILGLGYRQLWTRTVRSVLAVGIGLLLVVGPWTIRNAVQLGAFIPISQSYKGVLAGANCETAYSTRNEMGGWFFSCVSAVDINGLDEVETFEAWATAGMKFALDHRADWSRIVQARILRTWGLFRPGRWFGNGPTELRSFDFAKKTMWTGWLLMAVAAVGLVLVTRRSFIFGWILFAPILTVTLTSAIAYGNPRFRAAAEPCLILLAAVTCTALWNALRWRLASGFDDRRIADANHEYNGLERRLLVRKAVDFD